MDDSSVNFHDKILLNFLLKFRKKWTKNLSWKFTYELSVKYLRICKWTRWIWPLSSFWIGLKIKKIVLSLKIFLFLFFREITMTTTRMKLQKRLWHRCNQLGWEVLWPKMHALLQNQFYSVFILVAHSFGFSNRRERRDTYIMPNRHLLYCSTSIITNIIFS